ncbi:MAG: hypothetical protein BWY45_02191 [Euryarchaeota archaeon ADurb.Bin294]|nr:MAG: hypothetical protein BWY45_02191 [Euryarchaeota archaeon ADurb.Bin294]
MNNKIPDSGEKTHPHVIIDTQLQFTDSSSKPLFGLLKNWKINTQELCDELRD